jgi:hypothetical protein
VILARQSTEPATSSWYRCIGVGAGGDEQLAKKLTNNANDACLCVTRVICGSRRMTAIAREPTKRLTRVECQLQGGTDEFALQHCSAGVGGNRISAFHGLASDCASPEHPITCGSGRDVAD